MPHFVKIELAYPKGWWTTSRAARLMDPANYAEQVFKNAKGCIGARIEDNDDGTVWLAGEAPEEDIELRIAPKTEPKRKLTWDDVL